MFFFLLEPGYYDEVLEFGIRLENVIRVAKVELAHDFQNSGWLGFEDMTFVPYSHKLINFALLTEDEVMMNLCTVYPSTSLFENMLMYKLNYNYNNYMSTDHLDSISQ